jgi:hypothetical protein
MSRPKPPSYRITNWHEYAAALAEPTDNRGCQPVFTGAAIQACLTLKALFGLPPPYRLERRRLSSDYADHMLSPGLVEPSSP